MQEEQGELNIYEALQKYFGYTSFITPQEQIIKEIMAGKDVFALLPTGGGKSLCYQLPALLLDGVAVVVSPLIALMKDQVDSLRENGIDAACINSTMSFNDVKNLKLNLLNNKIKILYAAPERIVLPEFISFLKQCKISLIAVDESHCISEWGHDFRPAYRQLKMLRYLFPETPIIALTATAISEVQADIINLLNLKDPAIFRASFDRKNLIYHLKPKADAYHQLLQFLNSHSGDSGIIYCFSRKSTEDLALKLQQEGFRALPYHAGLDSNLRTNTQDQFINDKKEIIVATIAFGMGIDKSNIRFVVHYDLPKNLESYYQETGRAGRDGIKSDCILFFSYGDIKKIDYMIEKGTDEKQKKIAYDKLESVKRFCEIKLCRRKFLLEYFGEAYKEENCGSCDNCLAKIESIDVSKKAQKSQGAVSEKGKSSQNTSSEGLRAKLSTTGLSSPNSHIDAVRIMQERPEDIFHKDLFEILRDLRKRLANTKDIPPYIIFHDSSLKEMATKVPRNLSEFRNIYGVGKKKIDQYGDVFIKEICEYRAKNEMPDYSYPKKVTNLEVLDLMVDPKQLGPQKEKTNEVGEWFHEYNRWSFTKHRLWNECRLAYYYDYVAPALFSTDKSEKQKLKELKNLDSIDLLKGKLIHEVIETQINRQQLGAEISKVDARRQYAGMVEEFIQNADRNLIEYFNGERIHYTYFDEILYDGLDQIEVFFNNIWPQIKDLEYLRHERFDDFNLGDIGVNVKLDLLCKRKDGGLLICDWKTGSDDPRYQSDLQIASYVLWATQKYGVELNQITCQLVYLKTAKIHEYTFSNTKLEEIKKQISGDFAEFNKTFDINYFFPSQSPHKCIKCRFSTVCTYSKASEYLNRFNRSAKVENIASQIKTDDSINYDGDNIENEKLLENTFDLKNRINDLQRELNGLKIEYEDNVEHAKTLGIKQQGEYRLELVVRKTRKVDTTIFRDLFPEVFFELASVPVTAAENIVGKEAIKEAIKLTIKEFYIITKTKE
jgi:ATP-dependent DNA helicase RecQ